jgi:dUTPase
MRTLTYFMTPLAEGIPPPARAHHSDSGYDLRTCIDFTIHPGEVRDVPTGLVFDIPERAFRNKVRGLFGLGTYVWELKIEQRTGNGGKGLFPAATVVDAGYRPNHDDPNGLTLRLRNVGSDVLTFKRGDAVMQGLFVRNYTPTLRQVPKACIRWNTKRGNKRFGATGR